MPAPVLHQAVVAAMGQDVVNGRLTPGQAVRIEQVEGYFKVSRSVAREALRILESLGMVAMTRRVGNVVQPRERWVASDPRVIRWRLASPHQQEELDQLMQLRAGLEPIAARLSAAAAASEVGTRLVELGDAMRDLGEASLGVSPEFLAADVEYHRLVLSSGGNDHLAGFADVVETVLTERNRLGLLTPRPDDRSMDLHCRIAAAIAAGVPDDAERHARALVDRVHAEVLGSPR